MLAVAAVGASTAAFMTLSHSVIQGLAPDGMRGRIMSANTWHVQGATSGFNAVNGLLMDVPWMTAPILLTGTGLLFVAIMLGSLLIAQLRTIYIRGVPTGGSGPLASVRTASAFASIGIAAILSTRRKHEKLLIGAVALWHNSSMLMAT